MATYKATADSDIVNKSEQVTVAIDMSKLVQRYIQLRDAYINLPVLKTQADGETLSFWNATHAMEREVELQRINAQAQVLYNDLKPIKDAGLLPAKYDDEFTQLEHFVNG